MTKDTKKDYDGMPSDKKWAREEVFANTSFDKPMDKFHWVSYDEVHQRRRREILQKHPEVKDLMTKKEPLTGLVTILLVSLQVAGAIYASQLESWAAYIAMMYICSATFAHSLQTCLHELTHNLAFKSVNLNHFVAIFANFGSGIPAAMSFMRYHREHHVYQGVDGIDTDLPTKGELNFFRNPLLKLVSLVILPLTYAFRPLFVRPKNMTFKEFINFVTVLAWDYYFYTTFGPAAFCYILGGGYLGMTGLHPCAGHLIAEHYEFAEGYETYSYYSWCNFFNLNVGYHNEHHDFPTVPWSSLPTLKSLAPEYYETIPYYDSYTKVLLYYVFDKWIGPWSRIVREPKYSKALKTKEE